VINAPTLYTCRYVPELGWFWADAASIGQEPAQFWHVYTEKQTSIIAINLPD